MENKEKRIKIAKACGWQKFETVYENILVGTPPKVHESRITVTQGKHGERLYVVPKYFIDLNAIQYAVKQQTLEFQSSFRDVLGDLVGWSEFHNATAEQRAEAFIQTLLRY